MRGVLDVPVSEVKLDGAGVGALGREIEAARMAQHVGMDGKGDAGCVDPRHLDDFPHPVGGDRGIVQAPPGREDMGRRIAPAELHLFRLPASQVAQFLPRQGVGCRCPVLRSSDMQQAGLHIDHVPAERDRFGDAEPVAVHDEDQGGITPWEATARARRFDKAHDFRLGQVFARATVKIRGLSRRGGFGGRLRYARKQLAGHGGGCPLSA